jgi:hypothetical protein
MLISKSGVILARDRASYLESVRNWLVLKLEPNRSSPHIVRSLLSASITSRAEKPPTIQKKGGQVPVIGQRGGSRHPSVQRGVDSRHAIIARML